MLPPCGVVRVYYFVWLLPNISELLPDATRFPQEERL